MNRDELQTTLFRVINRIAPEVDLTQVDQHIDFRDQVDIDSFDFLNIVIGLHEALAVDIPETDYPRLGTIGSTLDYLESALSRR